MTDIYDPIHNFISVNHIEESILDTETVQRLRRVRQLGLSSMVYPGATHTRFEHSLGVMHIAGRYAQSLGLSEGECQLHRLAGLLHDVGHGPFSHATEWVMEEYMGCGHEEIACRMVDEIEAPNLSQGDKSDIQSIIKGNSKYGIVAGEVDADRMDYLARDAYEAGPNQGGFGVDTLITFAELESDSLVFDRAAVNALDNFFESRLLMTRSVYQHKTVRIVERMLGESVRRLLESTALTPQELVRQDDSELRATLSTNTGASGEIYQDIKQRKLYKNALQITELTRQELSKLEEWVSGSLHEIEQQVASDVGIPPHKVIIDPPRTPTDPKPEVLIRSTDSGVTTLADISTHPERVEAEMWNHTSVSVFCPEEYTSQVSDSFESLLSTEDYIISK